MVKWQSEIGKLKSAMKAPDTKRRRGDLQKTIRRSEPAGKRLAYSPFGMARERATSLKEQETRIDFACSLA